jgi:hypothetical protein
MALIDGGTIHGRRAPTRASIPIKHGGMLASRVSNWLRRHF